MDRPNELPNEPDLVAQAVTHPAAFAPLYDHYAGRVYTFFRYRVDDIPTAEDLTAQTFERALKDIGRCDLKRGSFSAWLFGIAHHSVSRHFRQTQRQPVIALAGIPEPVSDSPAPEHLIIKAETAQQLAQAVALLRDHERELIALKFAAGLPNTQIAKITGHTENNIGVMLYRTIQKLRRILTAEGVHHD